MTLTEQVAVFLAATVIVVPLFRRFKLSAVLGYIAAGLLIGPWGLGLVDDVESVLHFAEFGVVLLLFVIGLELQPSRLLVMRHAVFGVGALQVALTTVLLAGAGVVLGLEWPAAVIVAFALSLSSTALILQVLAERGELTARHGRATFAVLLFQDLAIMPALLVLPWLAGAAGQSFAWASVLMPVAVVVLVVVAGRHLLRPVLRIVAQTRAQEAFTAAALLLVVGTALLFQRAGLSMALGAFIAGVLLADSEYRHELEADIEPFKGLLLGLFFIAVGMSANLGLLVETPVRIALLTLGYLALKVVAVWIAARLTRHDAIASTRIAVALAGGGEFAFVLLALAAGDRLVPRSTADTFVLVVTASMALAPLLIGAADRVARRFARPVPPRAFDRIEPEEPRVLIAGFGRVGQIVARVLRARQIRFTALEASPAQVDFVRRFGNKLYYGDASRLEMLRAAGAEHATVLVLAIDDVEASVKAAELARRHFPQLKILARARNRQHAFRLMDAGVADVWRETFGTSLEMAESTLVALGTGRDSAAAQVRRFRAHDEETLRQQAAVKDDEEKLIATTQASAKQLESLFEADRTE
ncbi:MAG TPA: monovalent cation:proton antiporter-2 (CPA2) family protein [Steroidobacteraceae bacterium]|nr:monovalent cation:proton antiporter-2 (CPA2) family protein [Steroidobacteraceae bacterium]